MEGPTRPPAAARAGALLLDAARPGSVSVTMCQRGVCSDRDDTHTDRIEVSSWMWREIDSWLSWRDPNRVWTAVELLRRAHVM